MKHPAFRLLTMLAATLLLLSCGEDDNPVNPDDNNPPANPAGMVLISAKDHIFQMGSESGFEDELPLHTVTFSQDFWLDSTEVTQGNYGALMDASYSDYSAPDWHSPYGVGARYPAYLVTWSDAALYCNARSKRDNRDTVYTYESINGTAGNGSELVNPSADLTKNGYRLPTEAEWEYACRGGSTTDFFWGKDYDPYPANAVDTSEVSGHAVWIENSWWQGSEDADFGTHPVASTSPNGYRLYDMAGNLCEWCHDWYGTYAADAVTDPIGPASGEWHVLRGGSWGNDAVYLRTTSRALFFPDYEYNFLGFRAALPVR